MSRPVRRPGSHRQAGVDGELAPSVDEFSGFLVGGQHRDENSIRASFSTVDLLGVTVADRLRLLPSAAVRAGDAPGQRHRAQAVSGPKPPQPILTRSPVTTQTAGRSGWSARSSTFRRNDGAAGHLRIGIWKARTGHRVGLSEAGSVEGGQCLQGGWCARHGDKGCDRSIRQAGGR